MQQDQGLSQEASRLWDEVFSSRYDYTHREAEVEVLRGLTQEDLLGFYNTYLSPGCKSRRKLSIHVLRNKEATGDVAAAVGKAGHAGTTTAAAAAAGGGEGIKVVGEERGVDVAEAASHVHHTLGGKAVHQPHQQQHGTQGGAKEAVVSAGEGGDAVETEAAGGLEQHREAADLGPREEVKSLEALRQQLPSYARAARILM
jgi:hypothetical protein